MIHGVAQALCRGPLALAETGDRLAAAPGERPFGVSRSSGERPVEERNLEIDLELVTEMRQGPCPEQGCRHPPRRTEARVPDARLKHRCGGVHQEAHRVFAPCPGRSPLVHPRVETRSDEEGCVRRNVALVVSRAKAASLVGCEERVQLSRDMPLLDPPRSGRLVERFTACRSEGREGRRHRSHDQPPRLAGRQEDGRCLGDPEQLLCGSVGAEFALAGPLRQAGGDLHGSFRLAIAVCVLDDGAGQPDSVHGVEHLLGVESVCRLLLGDGGILTDFGQQAICPGYCQDLQGEQGNIPGVGSGSRLLDGGRGFRERQRRSPVQAPFEASSLGISAALEEGGERELRQRSGVPHGVGVGVPVHVGQNRRRPGIGRQAAPLLAGVLEGEEDRLDDRPTGARQGIEEINRFIGTVVDGPCLGQDPSLVEICGDQVHDFVERRCQGDLWRSYRSPAVVGRLEEAGIADHLVMARRCV